MKIRTIFAAAAITVGAIGSTVGVVAIATAWSTWSQERAAADLASSFTRLLVIPQRIVQERTAFTRVMEPAEPTAAQRGAVPEARRATDAALVAARGSVEQLGGGFTADVLRGLATVQTEMQGFRDQSDRLMPLAHAERLRGQPELSTASLAIQGRVAPLIDAIESRLEAADGELGNFARLARVAADLRESASATIIPLGGGLRQGRALTPEENYRHERGLVMFDTLRAQLRFNGVGARGKQRRAARPLLSSSARRSRIPRHQVPADRGRLACRAAVLDQRRRLQRTVVDPMAAMFDIRDAALNDLAARADQRVAGSAHASDDGGCGAAVRPGVLLAGAAFVFQRKVLAALERIAGLMGDVAKGGFLGHDPGYCAQGRGRPDCDGAGVCSRTTGPAHAGARCGAEVGAGQEGEAADDDRHADRRVQTAARRRRWRRRRRRSRQRQARPRA
jgi:hypothetical protein